MNHHFIIEGCRETGKYIVYEGRDGKEPCEIHTVKNMKKGGLKECWQYIGKLLKDKYGYALNQIIPHQCVKPNRQESKNPYINESTVQDYIDGIDPQKKIK